VTNDFTIGVEEEYHLVDRSSGHLAARVDDVLPEADERGVGEDVSHELKRTQIEIGTVVCSSLEDVRADLVRLRTEVSAAAAANGLAILAAGSHPMASMLDDDITDEPDYRAIADRYAHLAREQTVCGCHVHVGVADRELAIAALNVARPWLPVLLALSASSPFWDGEDTGYASYRTEVFGRWPTAGPPEPFASRAEFDGVVADLLATGSIDAPARIYWDARPSARYETIEIRVADVCTSIDDAVLVAGLAAGLVRAGVVAALDGAVPAPVRPEVVRAARWRAARYGLSGDLVDVVTMRAAPAADVVWRLVDVVAPQLAAWGELDRVTALVTDVLARGSSAERQRQEHARRRSLDDVVAWLVAASAPPAR
jgi:carboxylate-amine ligase